MSCFAGIFGAPAAPTRTVIGIGATPNYSKAHVRKHSAGLSSHALPHRFDIDRL